MSKVIILSGGFDPIHSGHIDMFKNAKENGDKVAVCVNSDEWLIKKKGINFLPIEERINLISSIKYVDYVCTFPDDENGTAVNGIKEIQKVFPDDDLFFGNGGDREALVNRVSEEHVYCSDNNIGMIWNLGGNKANSSSWILNRFRDWHFETTERPWGNYKVIYQDPNKKVKIIEVLPQQKLSLQSHEKRSEHWVVVEGQATIYIETEKYKLEKTIEKNESHFVPIQAKHRLSNQTDEILKIVEVQIGSYVGEDDITRYDDMYNRGM